MTGIPTPERFIGKLLLKRWCRKHPPGQTVAIVDEHAGLLAAMASRAGGRCEQRAQIKRLPGLEASSTNYSLAMTIEHLAIVNQGLAGLLVDLRDKGSHHVEVRTADYKPSAGVKIEQAFTHYSEAAASLRAVLTDQRWLDGCSAVHEHPWFGALPASTWACFPSFHGSLHLKQAELIAARLA